MTKIQVIWFLIGCAYASFVRILYVASKHTKPFCHNCGRNLLTREQDYCHMCELEVDIAAGDFDNIFNGVKY